MKKTLDKKIKAVNSKPEQRKFAARFDADEYAKIEAEAARQNISMNSFIKVACREAIETLARKKTG